MALTQEQRDRAIRITLDECAGRVPVIAGCMTRLVPCEMTNFLSAS